MADQSTPWTLYIFSQGTINSCGRKAHCLSPRKENFPVALAVKNNKGKIIPHITNEHHVENANILDEVMKFQWILRALCLISFVFVSYLKTKTYTLSTHFLRYVHSFKTYFKGRRYLQDYLTDLKLHSIK